MTRRFSNKRKNSKRFKRTTKPKGHRKRTKKVKVSKFPGIKEVSKSKDSIVTYWPSTRKNKKWMTITPDGKKVHWGHPTMKDFTKHKSLKRRSNYRKRHAGILLKDGTRAIDKKWSPAWLSYYVTW
jgi:hypothetical protein